MTNTNTATNELNTSATGTSVLRSLRSLMPMRVLSYSEALNRAELQANRLLALTGLSHGPVPIEIVTELPRIRVERTFDLPVSGSAHWDGSNWVLNVNASEYDLRQRFSVLHEFKHVVDHTVRHLIRGDKQARLTAEVMAEKVADYFAACVLMPKAWVKAAFCNQGIQSTEALADLFQVSPKAMSVRLSQLGLARQVDRCGAGDLTFISRAASTARGYWPQNPRRSSGRYFRALPANTVTHCAVQGVCS